MQNKANFRKAQMNVNSFITKDYIKNDAFAVRKNKPNSNPNKANTKPIKANKMPKQTQNKPNQTQSQDPTPKGVSGNWRRRAGGGQVGKILTCQIGNKV